MLKFAKVLVCSLLMCLWAVSASADVTYNFQTTPPDSGDVYGGFTLTVSNFISADVGFIPPQFVSGTFHKAGQPTWVFNGAYFEPNFYISDSDPRYDIINFGGGDQSAGQGLRYFFPSGIFGAVGTHDATDYGFNGHLVVSGTGTVTAAPEPATMLLLGLGLAGLAGVRRRFQK